jgi:hypothetical protein
MRGKRKKRQQNEGTEMKLPTVDIEGSNSTLPDALPDTHRHSREPEALKRSTLK